ncbi:MAG: hypothetical protein LKJ83_07285 [Eubacteriaceae bacterium]|jgi:succinyl-CoA synthetase beta subunit|nr:hypothetical protein [Eubacteriaceae bacterium]
MNLFEYEGKELMKKYEIPVPLSGLVKDYEVLPETELPFVLKGQVDSGGRGKAGAVQICETEEDFLEKAPEIMSVKVKGRQVVGLLAEEMCKVDKELYLSIMLQGVSKPTLIISEMGGMNIEEVAASDPDKILKVEIDPFTGLKSYQLKMISKSIQSVDAKKLSTFIKKIERMFVETGAVLVEINPLGVKNGELIAMDSKIVLDDHVTSMAEIRENFEERRNMLPGYISPEVEKTTVTFIPLEGNVGLISDGAGTGMMSLDLLYDEGLEVSSFAELGGMTSEKVMYRALELTFNNNQDIKALLIVLIGGFNRMDNMAKAIIRYVQEHNITIPLFTRMCGTKEVEGTEMMERAGIKTYYDLTETVKTLAASVRGGVE